MFIRTAKLVCDRCDSEVTVSPRIEKPFALGSPKRGSNYDGWAEIGQDYHLCPVCYADYSEVLSENSERLRRFMEGPSQSHSSVS